MQLLFFLKIGVVLGESLESEFVSGLDVLGLGDVPLLESLDLLRVSG